MNPHSDKNIGQLRKHASSLGITMASRKKKDELLSLIAEREQARQIDTALRNANAGHVATGVGHHVVTPDGLRPAGTMYGQPVTRGERDALKATPVVLFDPAGDVTKVDLQMRRGFPRFERRHSIFTTRTFNGVQQHIRNIPRHLRREGVMTSATALDLKQARVATGTSAFGVGR